MRVFVGLELPEPVKASLLALRRTLPGARWQQPHQLHLTLRFIGELGADRLPELVTVLSERPESPFWLRLQGVGTFGSLAWPRVLWVGAQPETSLVTAHECLNRQLAPLGWGPEGKHFRPHVTLARFGRSPSPVGGYIGEVSDYRSPDFRVDAITLFCSRRYPQGVRYEVLHRFPCRGATFF